MKDKAYLTEFVKNIFDDNFSEANINLSNCINEKIKTRMKNYMVEKKYVPSDDDEDDEKFEKIKKKHNKEDKKEKSNKPKRGGKRD